MAGPFAYFVILADMRTGSNYLEARLNAYPGLESHGELFNPVFIGREGRTDLFGTGLDGRDADPLGFLARVRGESAGLPGFRLFPGHAPRVLDACLSDRACAKIVLTRNPLDSYLSLKIARTTGQWWMDDASVRRAARVRFDADEFEDELHRRSAFYEHVRRSLVESGQAPFSVRYTDLGSDAVMDGLARYLGITEPSRAAARSGRVQNPGPARDKVENPGEMTQCLARLDMFGLLNDPDFEPRRGPNVRTWIASDAPARLFLPIPGGPNDAVRDAMHAAGAPLRERATRQTLREWQAAHPGHVKFTVVSHPVLRAWRAFRRHIVNDGPDRFTEILNVMERRHGLVVPGGPDTDGLRSAFLTFLGFLKLNLAGQTSVRVPAVWASQVGLLRAMSDIALPDAILREDRMTDELARLLGRVLPQPRPESDHHALLAIYDDTVEAAALAACRKDYIAFGFGAWGDQAA